MNNQNKNKRRFNIIDVLIIIIVVAVAFFCIYIFNDDFFNNRIVTVDYIVRIDGITDADSTAKFENGNRVYSTDENIPIGVITSSKLENMKITVYNSEADRFETVEQEDVYTLYLYIKAGCIFKDGAYKTENLRISENTSIDINVPFIYDSASIIEVIPNINSEE